MAFKQPSVMAKGHQPRGRGRRGTVDQQLAQATGQQQSHSQTLLKLLSDNRNSPVKSSRSFSRAEGEQLQPCHSGISLPALAAARGPAQRLTFADLLPDL